MDRIERIDSPQPHERTWAVTRARERDAEREQREQRKQRERPEPPPPPDYDEPPRLVDVRA
jgi:hypothetical protein